MLHDYYHILGVTKEATLEQLKKAYRLKAKLLHPDVNLSINAHNEFVLLNEAFEYLKNKKISRKNITDDVFNNCWKEEKNKANKKAAEQASMRYEEYINSDEYRYLDSINVFLDHFLFLLTLTVPILLPIMFFNWYGLAALLPVSILLIFTSPYIFEGWGLRKKININLLSQSLIYLLKFDDFRLMLLSIINVYVFWNYALVTMIEMRFIFLIYALAAVFSIVFWYYKFKVKTKLSIWFILIGISPFVANSTFLMNFYICKNRVEEVYSFEQQRGATIRLAQDSYDDFTFIRFFPNTDKIGNYNQIKLNFADGIYGWRVLKSYELLK